MHCITSERRCGKKSICPYRSSELVLILVFIVVSFGLTTTSESSVPSAGESGDLRNENALQSFTFSSQ